MDLVQSYFECSAHGGGDYSRLNKMNARSLLLDDTVARNAQAGVYAQDPPGRHCLPMLFTIRLTTSPGRFCVPASGSVRTTLPPLPSVVYVTFPTS